MKQFASIRETMMVPMLTSDGTFMTIQVDRDARYQIISNDCGPVVITLAGIILPKSRVLVSCHD